MPHGPGDLAPSVRAAIARGEYAFAPPLSATTLNAAELALGLRFPREYRSFLTKVSAGGVVTRTGPPELIAFDRARDMVAEEGGDPSRPCALTRAIALRLLREQAQRRDIANAAAHPADLRDGVWPLRDLGCGMLDILILTGPQRGTVWHAWERGWSPLYFRLRGRLEQHRFGSWLAEVLG